MIYVQENKLVFRYDDHILWVEAWGDNSLRVRATKLSSMPERDWALTELVIRNKAACTIETHSDGSGSIHIGKVQATISKRGKLTVTDDSGRTLLEEYVNHRLDLGDPKCSALEIEARELRGDYHCTLRLKLSPQTRRSMVWAGINNPSSI